MHKRSTMARRVGVALWVTVPIALVVGFLLVMSQSYALYVVHTGSMSPTIPSKSAVLVHKGEYTVGQVVAFREGGDVVTHRVVAMNGNSITTKGDANTTNDPWTLTRADIIGGAVLAPRELGYWMIYLRNPAGLASMLLSIVCVGLIWSIASSVEERSAGRVRSTHDPLHSGQPGLRTSREASTVIVLDKVAAPSMRYRLILGASGGALVDVVHLPAARGPEDERAPETPVIATYSPV